MKLIFLQGEGWFFYRTEPEGLGMIEQTETFPTRKAALAAQAAGQLKFAPGELPEGMFAQIVESVLSERPGRTSEV